MHKLPEMLQTTFSVDDGAMACNSDSDTALVVAYRAPGASEMPAEEWEWALKDEAADKYFIPTCINNPIIVPHMF
jgi:hypothetical protein